MKFKVWKLTPAAALLLALTLTAAMRIAPGSRVQAQQRADAGEDRSDRQKLEGTWRVQVTIRVCQTGAEIRTFPSLVTFARGGTMTETTTAASPALRGPGHGVWEQTGADTYNQVFEAFTFNPAGAWTGTQRVTHTVHIGRDRDELSSSGTSEIFDANGTLLVMGCSTAVGRRLE